MGEDFAGPGPIYNPKIVNNNSRHQRVVGGSALANTAPRFVYKANDTPGPGTYEIMRRSRWLEKGAVSMDPPTIPKPPPEDVKVFITDPDRSKAPKRIIVGKLRPPAGIPSIPDGDRIYGYQINRDGKLTINDKPDLIQPLYGGGLPKYATEKFHGCKFGGRTALRDTNWAGPPGPAPNCYLPTIPKQKNFSKTQPLLASAWGLHSPSTNYPKQRVFSDTPAPNTYDVRGDIPKLPEGNAPFDMSAKRFVYVYNQNPAPGAYGTKEHMGDAATVAPLSFTAPKFGPPEESTPGPSDYEMPPGVAEDAAKKCVLLGAPHGAFGVSQGRDFDPASKEETPAPNTYNPKRAVAGPDPKVTRRLTSSFASRAPIGLDPRLNAGFGNPAPNEYESGAAFGRLKSARRAPPRTKDAKQRQTVFNYYAQRFHDIKNDVPAPCTYHPDIECKCMSKGRFTVHDEKLKPLQASVGPGPAYFPKNGNIGIPPTFNATLGYAREP